MSLTEMILSPVAIGMVAVLVVMIAVLAIDERLRATNEKKE